MTAGLAAACLLFEIQVSSVDDFLHPEEVPLSLSQYMAATELL